MDAVTLFRLCLAVVVALSAMQVYLTVIGVTRYNNGECVQLARLFTLLCVSNVAVFSTSLAGLYALDQLTKNLAHAQALGLRGEANPAFLIALFLCPLYACMTGWMSFALSQSKTWRTGLESRAIYGQVVMAAGVGIWSTLILLR